jgi:hypothetical protein
MSECDIKLSTHIVDHSYQVGKSVACGDTNSMLPLTDSLRSMNKPCYALKILSVRRCNLTLEYENDFRMDRSSVLGPSRSVVSW